MFQSNKINLIISIVLAIAVWVYVVTFIDPETTDTIRDIQVELTNLETLAEDGLTVAPSQSFTVDIIVKGSRSNVGKLAENSGDVIKATANMTGHPMGEGLVQVHIDPLPDGIELVEILPDQINVVAEELVSVTKPVRMTYDGEFPKGMEPGFITIAPQEVEVSGTKELVDSIAFVSAVIDSADLSEEEQTITTDLVAMQDTEKAVYNVSLSQETVDVTATLLNVKEVPLKLEVVGAPKGDDTITNIEMPSTVFIRGSEEDIADITEVEGNDINIDGLKETMIFIPDLYLPKGVQLASASLDLSITVEIRGIMASNIVFSADQFEIVGLPVGYTAHVNTGTINVNVFGTREVLEALEEKNLTPYVDMNGVNLAESSVELEVNFKNTKGFTKIESVPDKVRVTIIKSANTEMEVTSNIINP